MAVQVQRIQCNAVVVECGASLLMHISLILHRNVQAAVHIMKFEYFTRISAVTLWHFWFIVSFFEGPATVERGADRDISQLLFPFEELAEIVWFTSV